MRKLLVAIVLLLAIFFVVTRLADIEQVVRTFQRGDPRWLALAVVVHLAALATLGLFLRAIYRVLGMEESAWRLMLVNVASSFVTVVTSTGGWGGVAVFAADARRRGLSTGRVAVAAAMYYLVDFLSALIVIGLGLIVLLQRNRLDGGELAAAAVLAAYACVLAVLLYLAWRSPERLGQLLESIGRWINARLRPLLRRDYLDVSRARQVAHDMGAGLHNARNTPRRLMLPMALALINKALMISVLFLVFLAFQQGSSVGVLIAGFGLAYLFMVVSPTPAGIGIVEGFLTLALNGLQVPLASAAVITLAYRGITLWLVVLYGMIAFRWIGRAAPASSDVPPPA
jgi:uncharacterized protein (TIRG00374 family)